MPRGADGFQDLKANCLTLLTKRKRDRGRGAAVVEAEPVYGKRQKWHLDQQADAEIREIRECT